MNSIFPLQKLPLRRFIRLVGWSVRDFGFGCGCGYGILLTEEEEAEGDDDEEHAEKEMRAVKTLRQHQRQSLSQRREEWRREHD